MNLQEILEHLQGLLLGVNLTLDSASPAPVLRVPAEHLLAVCQTLRDGPALSFDCLMCLSGLETADELQTVYHLYSMKHGHKVNLRCGCPKADEVEMPSVASIWRTAEWHEREAYDLIGIRYIGNPDLRRILLPEDWTGHPLRKDYQAPEFWHNISLTVGPPLQKGSN